MAIPLTTAFRFGPTGIKKRMLSAKEIALPAVVPSNMNVMPNRQVARNAGRLIK
jgi:hypothetical protein